MKEIRVVVPSELALKLETTDEDKLVYACNGNDD